MIRKEAIEILKRNKPTSDPRMCGTELCEAVDMAIEALSHPKSPKGRWVEIPCNIGDTVYWVMKNDFEGEWDIEIMTGKVFAIGIDENLTMWISVRYDGGLKFYHPLRDFETELFLNKDEAEKALADMRGEQE